MQLLFDRALLTKFRSIYWSQAIIRIFEEGVPRCVMYFKGGSEMCDKVWQGEGSQNWSKIAWHTLWTAPNMWRTELQFARFQQHRQYPLEVYNKINSKVRGQWIKRLLCWLPCPRNSQGGVVRGTRAAAANSMSHLRARWCDTSVGKAGRPPS